MVAVVVPSPARSLFSMRLLYHLSSHIFKCVFSSISQQQHRLSLLEVHQSFKYNISSLWSKCYFYSICQGVSSRLTPSLASRSNSIFCIFIFLVVKRWRKCRFLSLLNNLYHRVELGSRILSIKDIISNFYCHWILFSS